VGTKEDINIIKLDSKNEKFEIKGWATNRIVFKAKQTISQINTANIQIE
jgi:hypothetical protein